MKFPVLFLAGSLIFPALAVAGSIDWPAALTGVAAGDTHWLEQAPALAAVADVEQAQKLEDALATALAINTKDTLAALSKIDAGKWPHMIGSDLVCVPPLDKSPAEIAEFYQRTRQALLETNDGARCLWILEASWEELNADKARKAK